MASTHCRLFKVLLLLCMAISLQHFVALAQDKPNDALVKRLRKMRNIDSAKTFSDSLLAIAKKQNDKQFEGRILFAQSYNFYKNGQEGVALDYARRAGQVTTPADSVTYVQTQTMIAWMLSRNGDTEGGLKTAFAILRETEKYGWRKLRIDCKVCISDLYRPVKNFAGAVKFAQQAADESLALRDTAHYIGALSMLAFGYADLPAKSKADSVRNLDKTISHIETLLSKAFEPKLGLFKKANLLGNLGTYYSKRGRLADAERVLNESMLIANEQKFATLQKHSLNELMTISIKQKQYARAVAYAERIFSLQSDANSSRPLQLNVYSRASEAYAGLKNYEKAFNYSEKARALKDSMLADGQIEATAELDKKYQRDKQLLVAANRNTLLKQQRNFIIAIAIIVLVGLIALYRWYSSKKQKEAAALAEEHRQLEKLDSMKSRFFANISHELKTPLTLILGPAQQLLNDNPSPELQRNNLRAITRNSKKLLDMVNELLDLGKIEAGNLSLKPRPVNLGAFVRLIYQGFASAAEYKQITYTLEANIDDKINVSLDREKFEKVANNLISNAIKFTPASRAVNVVAGVADGMISFSVQDNGSGIHPDDVAHVFDRYYQGHRDEMPADGGTGIGLSIAKEFAELMGGRIELTNNWGDGSTFKVLVPLAPVTVQDSEVVIATKEPIAPKRPAVNSTEQDLILLVEDHEEMMAYVSSVLAPYYRVVTAGNGLQALEQLQKLQEQPKLIISDVMMPGMDGFTLLDKLKNNPAYYRIPVIMLTALADGKNKLRALNIGVDDYLTKPFVSNELLARAANLLHNAADRATIDFREADEFKAETQKELVAADDDAGDNQPHIPSPADQLWLARAEEAIRRSVGKTDLNITTLSYDMDVSERQLFRRIKAITGLTPNKYIRIIRLQVAREAIDSGKYRTMAEIAYLAGFETPAYFSKLFKEHYGREVNGLL